MFGEIQIAETPATDPKYMVGRSIEVSAAELINQPKFHMKLYFKIVSLNGKRAFTKFNGFGVTKEYLFRMVRKRTSKLNIINEVETKDKWKLQMTTITVLNRKAETVLSLPTRISFFIYPARRRLFWVKSESVMPVLNLYPSKKSSVSLPV